MTQNRLLIMIIIISSCFFAVSLLFNQGKCVVTSLIRGVCGMVVIGMANTILSGFGVFVPVGINFLNFADVSLTEITKGRQQSMGSDNKNGYNLSETGKKCK